MGNLPIVDLLRKKRVLQASAMLIDAACIRPEERDIPVPIEKILASRGILVSAQSISADGYLTTQQGRPHIFVSAKRNGVMRRFILAHEFGHWLLKYCCGVDQEILEIRNGKEVAERLCDEFAAALLTPTRQLLDALRRDSEGVTFRSIENMSREFKVPVRAVLGGISRGGELSRLGKGILIVRPMSNPWGGSQWHLRIWRAYCPDWGFVPERRLERIGLHEIATGWSTLRAGTEISFRENLCVHVAQFNPASGKSQRSWKVRRIEAVEVHYKVYRDSEEGLFAVGIFDWSRPGA